MDTGRQPVGMLSLGTAVPPYRIDQEALRHWTAEALGSRPALSRWLKRLYELSGIETRHSCLPDAESLNETSRFTPGRRLEDTPTTEERMAIYQRESVVWGAEAGRRALAELGDDAAAGITHLIVVSCTGFFAPGLDLAIARALELRPTVQRTLVGFMGCAAAFNALRLADSIVRGQPEARVLVVCVELCSLHIQPGDDRISMVIASLFADGAAACVVGASQPGQGDLFAFGGFFTGVQPETEQDMAWRIGNHGFIMNLSPDVPRRVSEVAPVALEELLDGRPRPRFWAIHPGGRAIVDRLVSTFALSDTEAAPSYETLRRYGNMSSPTVLFVLHALRERLRTEADEPAGGVAMAFGPGLVTEMAHLTYHPSPSIRLKAPGRRAISRQPSRLATGD